MKVRITFLIAGLCLLSVFLTAAQEPQSSPPPDPVVPLRARLLDFSTVLANEGFRLRDGFWSGRLDGDKPRRLAVNLFAGNSYWFCAAAAAPEARPVVALYDPRGEPVAGLVYDGEGLAAVGVTAATTGRYLVEVKAPRGGASDFCLIYLFK
jgi:hypothetical protein